VEKYFINRMVKMANRQELSKLNEEIELLESAGLIKAASVLHKKFIKESQAVPQPGGQSNKTNANIEVIKPGQTPPPTQATPPTPPTQPTLPPLPPGYNIQDNYYQDPRTGGNVYIDPRTGQPFEGGLTKGYGTPGTYSNPGGGYYTVPPVPGTPPTPAPAPGNTPPTIDLGIPSFKDRYDFYYGKVDQGFNIQDPQQQQEYFKRLKEQILNQLLFGLIDQKTYNDLMRLFAR
jgi:hypothetical protein